MQLLCQTICRNIPTPTYTQAYVLGNLDKRDILFFTGIVPGALSALRAISTPDGGSFTSSTAPWGLAMCE